MAYSKPKTWVFQDTPDATEMGKYPDNNEALAGQAYLRVQPVGPPYAGSNAFALFEHRHPWLYYKSESEERPGEIVPYNYTLEDVTTLPYAPDGAFYDLEGNHAWIVLGRMYELEHVLWAFEIEFQDCE